MAGAANMTSEEQSHILGGEAAEWTEYITPEITSFRIWPRAAVIAERLWSPRDTTDVASMYARLAIVSQELAYTGIPFRAASGQMLERLAGNENLAALKVLASVVEPPKEYAREELRSYDLYTALNRMVDAVPAESDAARIFSELAKRIASGQGTPADFKQARESLTLWRDNDAILEPQLSQSELTAELAPLSRNLSQAATIGLLALDAIEKGQPVSASTQQQWLTSLKALEAPQAILLDKIVPGVETLVDQHAI